MEIAMSNGFSDAFRAERKRCASGSLAPLSGVRSGCEVVVARVSGNREVRKHLASIGFVEGARVRIVSTSPSSIIVDVKGARFGLDAQAASRILVH